MNRRIFIISSNLCVLLLFCIENAIAQSGTNCVTPFGETATCILLTSCPVLKAALETRTEKGRSYTLDSHCGFEGKIPLVCCGTLPYDGKDPLDEIIDNFYKSSTTPRSNDEHLSVLLDLFGDPKATDDKAAKIEAHNFNPAYNLPIKSECGLEMHESWQDGDQTDLHESPWMVLLEYQDGVRCAGVLISKRFVLTTAECIANKGNPLISVHLGEWNLHTNPDCVELEEFDVCTDPVMKIKTAKTIPHPFYNQKLGSNNIGLVKLQRDVIFTDFVRPICLTPQDYSVPEADTPLTVMGWGRMENDHLTSNVKLKGVVSFRPFEECKKKDPEKKPNKQGFSTNLEVLRACGKRKQKNVCQASLGGPIMRNFTSTSKGQSQWYLEGVVIAECDPNEDHVVYIRVSRYIDWIIESITSA